MPVFGDFKTLLIKKPGISPAMRIWLIQAILGHFTLLGIKISR